ncbi:MAG: transferrin-binding protein-like solute binding protein [Geminicoccaceae bacterium]
MSKILRSSFCVLLSAGMAACSGGGGGGHDNGPASPTVNGGGNDVGSLIGEARPSIEFAAAPNTANGSLSLNGATTDILFDGSFRPTIKVTGRGSIATMNDAPVSSYDGFNVYVKHGGTGDTLMIANSADKSLNYTAFGVWAQGDIDTLLANERGLVTDAASFFGGAQTSVPATGTATYRGSATAIEVAANDSTTMGLYTGAMSASVDFGARTMSGSMALRNAATNANLTVNTGDMSITTASGRFGGSDFISSAGHVGSGNGRFFGPDQNEIGGAFRIANDTSTVIGAFGGAKDTP